MDARMQACFMVNTLAPMDVPKELATSLAPMPNAKMKAMMNPTMIIHNWSSGTNMTAKFCDNNGDDEQVSIYNTR